MATSRDVVFFARQSTVQCILFEPVSHFVAARILVNMQIIVPLLRVLVLMHEQHILHRDIKPENIFLTGKQKLKLGDLGLAIRSTEELPFTRSGTLDYMAPEVWHVGT